MAAALLVVALLSFGVLRAVTGPSDGLALTATSAAPQAGGELRGEQIGDNLKIELEAWGLPEPRGRGILRDVVRQRRAEDASAAAPSPRQPDGRATVSMSAPVSAVAYPEIEITQEPDDGDPGSSGKVVLKGRSATSDREDHPLPSRVVRTVARRRFVVGRFAKLSH